MTSFNITDYDKKIYDNNLKDFLPDKIIDAHTHIWEKGKLKSDKEIAAKVVSWPYKVAPFCTIEDLMLSYEQMFPGKTVKPVLMTSPEAELTSQNIYALNCAKAHKLPALFCISHNTPADTIRKAMTDGFCGIKPYVSNSPKYIPTNELRIYDFLSPEQLTLMDELGGIVMLHIGRPGRLRDSVNLAQLMEIDEKYPRARIIVAHIGRAYTTNDIGNAFDVLRRSKNLLFDFTANTLTKAMVDCIDAVGTQRLLFGSDMPITKMRMYRIEENGIYVNVVPRGMYGDVSGDKNMRETDEKNITSFMYEELLAFKRCADELQLSRKDVADIMCNNAARLFGVEI